jgi:hypothetical protein
MVKNFFLFALTVLVIGPETSKRKWFLGPTVKDGE